MSNDSGGSGSEEPLEGLLDAVEAAENTQDRLHALSNFFAEYDKRLSIADPLDDYILFNHAAFLLGARVADGVVWDWWQEQARTATTSKRQEELRIALFEMVPEPPITWSGLFRLWDFWFDPQARWALFSAYWWFPRRLRAHLARYTAHRRRFGLSVPEFSHDEFHAWLRHART